MASFGESFIAAYDTVGRMQREDEEAKRAKKIREELAAAVKPGDVIGARGSAQAYDAARFSTDAGVDIGNRPLADFQGAQPAAALAPAPQAMPPIAPAPGMRAAAQLTPELAGQAGIVRPTALAGGPPQPAPVAPSRGMASVGALPVAPLGQGMGVPADTVALPDPSKMVFYRDPTTGKGMAVEKGRERAATDADAAISAASIYMANGDVQTATKMMREAYALREASFKDEQITLQRALISAGVQNGGMTPAAIAQFAEVYNDKVEDGVKLTPSVGPDGGLALGVGSDNADTPMLWVNPTDGSMSRTPVYVTGAQAGAYLQTLITGNYADYQANIVQAQTAAATAARLDKQLANDTRRVDAVVKAADLDEAHWNELRPTRMAALDGTEAQTDYTRANTRRTDAQSVYEFGDSLPVRTNNGGALEDGPFARSQPGYTGTDPSGRFATFATPEAGAAAQVALLRGRYIAKGQNTIQSIIEGVPTSDGRRARGYAPRQRHGGDNTDAQVDGYISYVARRAGVDPTQPIPESKLPAVAAAMREFESGNTASAPQVPPALQKAVMATVAAYAKELRANQGLSYAESMSVAEEEVIGALPAEQRRYYEVAAPAAAPAQGIPTVAAGMSREQATAEVLRRRQAAVTARTDAAQRGTAAGPGHGAPPGQTRRKSAFEPLLGSD